MNSLLYTSVHEIYANKTLTPKAKTKKIHRNYYILSTMYVTQNKLHQSNKAFKHTHNPVDEEGTQMLIKVHNAHKDHSIQC